MQTKTPRHTAATGGIRDRACSQPELTAIPGSQVQLSVLPRTTAQPCTSLQGSEACNDWLCRVSQTGPRAGQGREGLRPTVGSVQSLTATPKPTHASLGRLWDITGQPSTGLCSPLAPEGQRGTWPSPVASTHSSGNRSSRAPRDQSPHRGRSCGTRRDPKNQR